MTTKNATDITVVRNTIYPIIFVNSKPLPAGALPGEFSVSSTKKVYFSKGNLQATYNGSNYTWGFAEHQYDYIGNAPGNTTIDGQSSGAVVDLFGWSTNEKYGINTSHIEADYSGDFKDWGKNIGDGNTWRTLSKDEWDYLFNTRAVNGGAREGKSYSLDITYGDKMGLVLYPDNYTGSALSGTVATLPEGVVFLPAAGYRDSLSVYHVGNFGDYWSSTADDGSYAYSAFFWASVVGPDYDSRYYGLSVRLITESE